MQRFILLLLSIGSLAATAQNGARLRIDLREGADRILQNAGFELDHGIVKPGYFIDNDYSAREIKTLNELGVNYEVVIENIETYYQERNELAIASKPGRSSCSESSGDTIEVPDGFELGSMGGFFTLEECYAHLDTMAARFPDLISTRQPIDTFTTHENRPIYWVKISDNPTVNESEPELLYSSIHHAREPQSLTQNIFFMYYLLENYGTDPEVTYLIENRELYFVPMINPDGYVYNQTTNPNGGGLWRKNRRDNQDGEFGVDLNRNYGFEWAYDNSGSSPNTWSETYRGPSAFSEPETKAMEWFCENHEFELALNYHSFGNYVIYPPGYIPGPLTPDSTTFSTIADELTSQNNYVAGTGFQTVGYAVNGDSDDWMYGEQTTKDKIISMTPEVGNQDDGFWPLTSRIIPLSKENVFPNLILAHVAGNYITGRDLSSSFLETASGSLNFEITRLGLQFSGAHSVALIPVSSNVVSGNSATPVTNLAQGESVTVPMSYVLDPSINAGEIVEFDLELTMDAYTYSVRISKVFGQTSVANNENGSNLDDFTTTAWSLTTEDFVSAPTSITDSPFSNYGDNTQTTILYDRIIDMRNAVIGQLEFKAKWAIEAGWDYCQLQARNVENQNWVPVCGKYTKEGNGNQDAGQPIWDGFQTEWITEEMDLSDFIGQRIQIRFKLVSDQFVNYDGFYFDDLKFKLIQDPSTSSAPDTGLVDTIGSGPIDAIVMLQEAPKISILPNPANEVVYVSSSLEKAVLELRDLRGRLVLQTMITKSGLTAIDLSLLTDGIYIYSVMSDEGQAAGKLVVSRQ